MRFKIDGRTIQQNNTLLGIQDDSGVESVEFVLPRYYNEVDLNEGLAFAVYKLPDKTEDQVQLDMSLEEDTLVLTWLIGNQITQTNGMLEAAIKISGLGGILWGSKITYFTIERSIRFESPQQPLYYRRGNLLALGGNVPAPAIADPSTEPPITVAERKINIPAALRTIAVQNDANSETVKIQMPRHFDGHDLYKYGIFLKTIMPNDNGRDDIPLVPSLLDSETLTMPWTLKPPQTSYSGSLGLQIYVIGTSEDGKEFKWETLDAAITIARSLDAEPAIPTSPSVFDDFIKQISEIKSEAKSSEIKAGNSASSAEKSAKDADASAKSAAASAANAKASEENAKKSETSAESSLTDINSGLAGKLSITEANSLLKAVSLDPDTGIFTFAKYDGTTFTIDTVLEKVAINAYVNEGTQELVFQFEDGTEQRVSLSAFFNIYAGKDTDTVQMQVSGSEISASIKGGSVTANLLSQTVQNAVNGKVTANADNNASQIKFADGKTMQEKLDAGDLNGKDGVNVTVSGMFYMRVDEFGHLKVGVADGAEPPPLLIKDGHLIYAIE